MTCTLRGTIPDETRFSEPRRYSSKHTASINLASYLRGQPQHPPCTEPRNPGQNQPSIRIPSTATIDPHPVSELTTSMSAQPRPRNLLRRLPLEIRLKIYPDALAMGWNYKLPNLFAALAEEPDLFEEATRVYLEINANIDCRNLIAYNSLLKKNEALKLEHLMIGCILTPYVPLLLEIREGFAAHLRWRKATY